ncbi:hypothetical protein SAY87_011452 [Trapa incisa]|uniref:RRM domain-containing protein n=1 Tax=Trapa incisa TaxID=236973 RepID=A0AAN7GL47_9MYRT|nr:hypothetical protein SAY87_011452 [Trapa incisa]
MGTRLGLLCPFFSFTCFEYAAFAMLSTSLQSQLIVCPQYEYWDVMFVLRMDIDRGKEIRWIRPGLCLVWIAYYPLQFSFELIICSWDFENSVVHHTLVIVVKSEPRKKWNLGIYQHFNMSEDSEYRCFIGGLAWSTSDRGLKDAFDKFGHLLEARVVVDKYSGRSRGFGFVTFDEKRAMEEAIEAMNGLELDGRNIIVEKAQPNQGSGRDQDRDRGRDHGKDRDRSGMEEGMINMEATGEVEDMVLTEMGIDQVVVTGTVGIAEAQEVTDMAGTALGLMSADPKEVPVEDDELLATSGERVYCSRMIVISAQ